MVSGCQDNEIVAPVFPFPAQELRMYNKYLNFIKFLTFILVISFFQFPVPCSGQEKKKVLYIDSYHAEYIWSRDITAGVRSVLNPRKDIELKIFRMDTKRNMGEADKKNAAQKARELIESWRPDVVIASDDNASKYLIAPYYKNAKLPFVFCGLNWDAAIYGFPADNITGMVEVAMLEPTIDTLKRLCRRGSHRLPRIGYGFGAERVRQYCPAIRNRL